MRRVLISVLVVIPMTVISASLSSCQRASDPVQPVGGDTPTAAVGTTGSGPTPTSEPDTRGDVLTTTLFRNIAKQQNPVVVAVTSESRLDEQDLKQLFGDDDLFSRFFGSGPRNEIRRALGSGFLVSPDGEILTNNHVVEGADQIRVGLFSDGHKTYMADVVGRDLLTDCALIKLKDAPGHLPAATLGNSDALDPGDWVMAIGNPFQLGHTVTVGVISFKGRPFAMTEGHSVQMLQTDASINPGNSGGPLIDVHGQVVGINTAIVANDRSGGNVGIGFAVPINAVKQVLPQLRKGAVQRGQLGVQILTAPVTDETAKQLRMPKAAGAIVSRVEPGSPAEKAGLRAGDVIVSYNGTAIHDAEQLTSLVVDTAPGSSVPIVFYRDGQQQHVSATIGKLELEQRDSSAHTQPSDAPGFGLTFGTLTPEIAAQLQLPSGTQGALVENVQPSTPAANAGLRPGDVILEINRRPVRSGDEAARLLRSLNDANDIFMLLNRQGVHLFVELKRD
jgi:serine protease Do